MIFQEVRSIRVTNSKLYSQSQGTVKGTDVFVHAGSNFVLQFFFDFSIFLAGLLIEDLETF
jgi:hypothetical protein